ncbi:MULTISPECIES: DUF4019 domain-containing protein [unclassified Massilia]|uniref:DUF4019 domain-containing protein n=1 Tax=unclassified Massilia TaxID=2609279 RepID=UPI000A492818|nr:MULTISPECIES: DUF4019 domain-containing protein [unclassified Massilia]
MELVLDAAGNAVGTADRWLAMSEHALPGASDDEYVARRYDTQFERKEHAVETVVGVRDQDGSWKVPGYFVK